MKSLFSLSLLIVFGSAALLLAQVPPPQYERGTIMEVCPHHASPGETEGVARYDVSVKVRNTLYVVLYEPPSGANAVKYAAGMDLLVSIDQDTLTFPSKLAGSTKVPILRKQALPPEPTVDWSKAPSEYYQMKMQNLTERLDLSGEQIRKVKPIAEQEGADASKFLFTTIIPRKERLKRWEKMVRSSDEQLKPFLTPIQWRRLQELRKGQKEELKAMLGPQTNASVKR